jgi:hypothetical protein
VCCLMPLRPRMSRSLRPLRKHLHKRAVLSQQPRHPKPNRVACGAGSLRSSAAMPKKKPSLPWVTKNQANAASAVMVAAPMAEAAVVVAVAVAVSAPNAVNAMRKAWKHVANVQHAASVQSVRHVKTATAADAAKAEMVKPVTPKAKPPSTTTHHLKLKPKRVQKHATNAWRGKSVARAQRAATNAQNVANVARAKAVANAAHAVSATKVAVNAPLA